VSTIGSYSTINIPEVLRLRLRFLSILSVPACLAIATALVVQGAGRSPKGGGDPGVPALGVLLDENLRVVEVDAAGSAARAGLRRGDVLRKIAKVSLPPTVSIDPLTAPYPAAVPANVPTSNEVKSGFLEAVPNWEHRVTIVLERHGKLMTLSVLITSKAFNYDLPTVTPVPSSLDTTRFYM
jgi:hypothetical protein